MLEIWVGMALIGINILKLLRSFLGLNITRKKLPWTSNAARSPYRTMKTKKKTKDHLAEHFSQLLASLPLLGNPRS